MRRIKSFRISPRSANTTTTTFASITTSNNKTVLINGAPRGSASSSLPTTSRADGTLLEALSPYKIVQIETSDEASILEAAKSLEGEAIDLLINKAGIAEADNFEAVTKESLLGQFEIDTVGPFLVTRAFVSNLCAAATKNSSALEMSSFVGSITLNDGSLGTGHYGYRVAKTGLNMVNKSLSLDLKNDNIVAVSLHPGYVNTDLTNHLGHINTDESVSGMAPVIAGIKAEDTGKFFDYNGQGLPW